MNSPQLIYSFPNSLKTQKFSKLKGVFLACSGVSGAVLGEESQILTFKLHNPHENRGLVKKPQKGTEAFINTVKVRPVYKPDSYQDLKKEDMYKAAFATLDKEQLLVVIIMSFVVPDNIILNAATEAKESLEQLLKGGFSKHLEITQITERKEGELRDKINKRLSSIFVQLFYSFQTFGFNSLMMSDSVFAACPLGVTPLQLPSVLSSGSTASNVQLCFSEKLLIDASEFLNAVYDDMSQINDLLTLKDHTLMLEGTAMFFKGFTVVSSLEATYM